MIGVIAYVIAQIAGQFIQIGRDVTLKQWAAHPGQDKFYLTLYAIAGFSGSSELPKRVEQASAES